MTTLNAVELFAGGGGLAVGLERAGIKPVAAIEFEPNAAATFKANHPDVEVFCQDVATVTGAELLSLAGGSVDILAACPPCQGYSSLTSRWRRTDPRCELVSEVARLTEEIKPLAVMIENVPGLAGKGWPIFGDLVARLEAVGYVCTWGVLQVADYGVPQLRRRLVLLAGLGFAISLPKPTHARDGAGGLARWKTVRETIGDRKSEAVTFKPSLDRDSLAAVDWHVVRRMSPDNVKRLESLKEGESGKDLPDTLRPACHRGGYRGFSNVYGRLKWDEPSATITAGCTTLSKGRFGHPEENRTLSLREAALLQTFPSDYKFETARIDKICEIIGNALPCDFAAAIASHVSNAILAKGGHRPTE